MYKRLPENLRTLMLQREISESELSRHTGVTQSTINRILRGETTAPTDRILDPIARYFDVPTDVLKRGALLSARAVVSVSTAPPAVIPVMDVEAIGDPPEIHMTQTGRSVAYQPQWRALGAEPADVLPVVVAGRAMLPTLWPGDVCILHRQDAEPIEGACYAVAHHGRMVIRRVHLEGDDLVLNADSDRALYPSERVSRAEAKILGRAIDRMGSGGL